MQVIEGRQSLGSIGIVLGVLQAPLEELEGALIAEASGLFPGRVQKRACRTAVFSPLQMLGPQRDAATESLGGLLVQAAPHARQKGLHDRFLHYGMGKAKILAVAGDQTAGKQTGCVECFVV